MSRLCGSRFVYWRSGDRMSSVQYNVIDAIYEICRVCTLVEHYHIIRHPRSLFITEGKIWTYTNTRGHSEKVSVPMGTAFDELSIDHTDMDRIMPFSHITADRKVTPNIACKIRHTKCIY